MKSNKILAIDYGTVRVGLALSYGSLAEPLQIVINNDDLCSVIGQICLENRVDMIVVGISENVMGEKSEAFAKELKTFFDQTNKENLHKIKFDFVDETLSSYEAGAIMKNRTLEQRKKPIDHIAAAIFLQNYLDTQGYEE